MKLALPLAALSLALLSACSTTPTQVAAPVAKADAPAATPAAKPAEAAKPAATPAPAKDPFLALKDPNNILSKRSVYFDYDMYEVKLDEFPIVEAHWKFLKANKTAKVLIQGNTDERGSREYNLALGQKRADAVKKTITTLGGVEEARIETVSLGEEKPKAASRDEASWAQNRRADILYSGEY